MARLPQPGGDSGNWGSILNDYLSQSLKPDGSIKDNIVTSNSLAPGSITGSALASGAVAASALADGSITPSKIQDNSISRTKLDSSIQVSLGKADSALQSIADTSISEAKLDLPTRAKLNSVSAYATALASSENSVTISQAGTAVTIALTVAFVSDGVSPTRLRLAGGTYTISASTTLTWDLYDPLNAQVIRQAVCPAASSGVIPSLSIDKVFSAGNCVVQARFKPGSNTTVTIINALTAPDQSPLQLTADKVIFA